VSLKTQGSRAAGPQEGRAGQQHDVGSSKTEGSSHRAAATGLQEGCNKKPKSLDGGAER